MSLIAALATSAPAQVTQRVSVDSAGAQGNGDSWFPSLSADGRYVGFESRASNLVAADTNTAPDLFVRDRQTGTTERVSVDSAGAQGNDDSLFPSLSADGRYVAFHSLASNLVAGDTNGRQDIFVRDRQLGTTERVSVDSGGAEANGNSNDPSISADGRYVAFQSYASNLVAGDTNSFGDVFVRDRQLGTTERVSVNGSGAQGNNESGVTSISADGRFVAFQALASNLVAGDANVRQDVFVRDRQLGTTELVSVDSGGAQANENSYQPSISVDGRFVAFQSWAYNLGPGDTNGRLDVFIRDRQLGTTERVSVDSSGAEANGDSYDPSVSADGNRVAFGSLASNLVAADTNGTRDVFLHDRQLVTTERVSVDSAGAQGNGHSYDPSISADGRRVAFDSFAPNLVAGDTNGRQDAFVRDRDYSATTSLCDPGTDGVIECPCENPSSGPGRGCDNASGTGGATLSATGFAYLSQDTLVVTASGEEPSALSLLVQGTAFVPGGAVYGRGVRCAGGTMKLLFAKTASGGTVSFPNFGAGDPTIHARSAAVGDPITAGQSRWYVVKYRDSLGGCPESAPGFVQTYHSFNSTQTALVVWFF